VLRPDKRPVRNRYVTTREMAAATQTSPQNSKMSSPKDTKTSLPVVTTIEGA
jgi:hypothetical protein